MRKLVGTEEELLDPQVGQVLDLLNLVAVKREHAQVLVSLKPTNLRDVVIVEVQILEVLIGVRVLNAHDLVAGIVHPLDVGRRSKVESVLKSVVRSVELDQMFHGAQWLEAAEIISRNVDVLQVLVLLDAIDRGQIVFGDGEAEEGMSSIVESSPNAVEAIAKHLLVGRLSVSFRLLVGGHI